MLDKRGVSLIEVILVIVILGVGIAMLLRLMEPGTKASPRPELNARGLFLAQDLLEEMRSKDFSGGASAGNRENYDDVDDYDGYGPVSPPVDIKGNTMTEYAGFSRSAAVCYVEDTDLDTCDPGPTDYKKLTVTVTWSGGSTILEGLRTDY